MAPCRCRHCSFQPCEISSMGREWVTRAGKTPDARRRAGARRRSWNLARGKGERGQVPCDGSVSEGSRCGEGVVETGPDGHQGRGRASVQGPRAIPRGAGADLRDAHGRPERVQRAVPVGAARTTTRDARGPVVIRTRSGRAGGPDFAVRRRHPCRPARELKDAAPSAGYVRPEPSALRYLSLRASPHDGASVPAALGRPGRLPAKAWFRHAVIPEAGTSSRRFVRLLSAATAVPSRPACPASPRTPHRREIKGEFSHYIRSLHTPALLDCDGASCRTFTWRSVMAHLGWPPRGEGVPTTHPYPLTWAHPCSTARQKGMALLQRGRMAPRTPQPITTEVLMSTRAALDLEPPSQATSWRAEPLLEPTGGRGGRGPVWSPPACP